MGTQKTSIRTNFSSARIAKPGTGGLLVISPHVDDAAVAANVIDSYRNTDGVSADHDEIVDGEVVTQSDLTFSAPFAQRNVQKWWMGSFADATAADAADRTFGEAPGPGVSTGTLPDTETRIYELTSVTIDGTEVDRIIYTANDPTTETLDNSGDGEVWFNPITRAFKTSRSSSGSGAGIILTYSRSNLSAIFAYILQTPVKTLTFGGNWRHDAQYIEMWRALTAFADVNDLMVYGAVQDDSDPTDDDFQTLITTNASDSIQLIAARQTFPADEDLGVAYAALNSKTPPNQTLKDQPAPRGITFKTVLPYTRDDYGDDKDPANDTFHKIGVNCIAPSDDGGSFIITSERCTITYSNSADILFGGARRTANAANDLVRFEVNRVLTDAKLSAKFNRRGMALVEGAFRAGLTAAAIAEFIDPEDTDLNFPDISETDEVDRKKRALDEVRYGMRVVNPLQTVDALAEVFQ